MISSRLHLAIADDHAVVRLGYRRLLEGEPDLEVVAEYADAVQAWADNVIHARIATSARWRSRSADGFGGRISEA